MKITILAASAVKIKESLDSLLPGNSIRAFEGIDDLYDYTVNSTLRTDVLLVEDYGVAKNPDKLNEAFMKLANTLTYRFFKSKRVIFLNKPDNEGWLGYYNYLKEELEDNDVEVVVSVKRHNINDVKGLILEMNKEYKLIKANDVVVIQKARGSDIETTQMIEDDGNDVGIVTTLPQFNRERAKAPFRNNTETINISEIPDEVPSMIVEEDFDVYKEVLPKDKFVIVTGVENSGVSTTSFIMSKSATDFGKVLLIDLDIHNMGMSYLADKVYGKMDGVYNINLEEVYTKSFEHVVNLTMNGDNLHILLITLKLIKKVEDIEFTLINFIERIKDRYDFIIFDTPLRIIKYYPTLLGGYVDRIIMTCLPYMNKLVSALKQIEVSNIVNMKAFRENKIAAFCVGMGERNGLKPVGRDLCRKYSKAILQKDILFSGIYSLHKQGYYKPKFFEDMMDLHHNIPQPNQENNTAPDSKAIKSADDKIKGAEKVVDAITNPNQKQPSQRIPARSAKHKSRRLPNQR